MTRGWPAPGHPFRGRSGAGFFWLLLPSLLLLGACGRGREREPADRSAHRLPLGEDTLDLGDSVTVATVRLGGTGTLTAVRPETVYARVGDVVRFVAADARGNAVAFQDSALSPQARAFLERTGQLRGPPLIQLGASWVVSLKDAPAGRYPFHSLTRDAGGVLLVRDVPPTP